MALGIIVVALIEWKIFDLLRFEFENQNHFLFLSSNSDRDQKKSFLSIFEMLSRQISNRISSIDLIGKVPR